MSEGCKVDRCSRNPQWLLVWREVSSVYATSLFRINAYRRVMGCHCNWAMIARQKRVPFLDTDAATAAGATLRVGFQIYRKEVGMCVVVKEVRPSSRNLKSRQ